MGELHGSWPRQDSGCSHTRSVTPYVRLGALSEFAGVVRDGNSAEAVPTEFPSGRARPRWAAEDGAGSAGALDIYTHVMPTQYREVADALDAWLGDGQGGKDDGR